jgi:outer membrane protein OmpA-like peptidoglycan-associated protein
MKQLILPFIMASATFGALDRDGILGIDKTFSAQTMHHGKLGIGLHTELVNDESVIEDATIRTGPGAANAHKISDYLTASSSIFLSLGLGPYTDISLAMPFYYEKFKSGYSPLNFDEQYNGDLRYRLKVRFPFSETQVLDLALLLGGSVPTQTENRGLIPRELEYFTNNPSQFNEGSSPFGAGRPTFLAALGMTLDLGQVAEKFQFLWHFNLGLRKTNLSRTPPFDDVLFWSTAAEYEAASFIRFFAEFYHESRFEHLGDQEFSTEPTSLTVGGVGHTPVGLEFYAGVIFGFDSKYIPVSYDFENNSKQNYSFNIKSVPDVSMFFQVCWNGFILKQDNDQDGIKNKEDNCPDDPEDKDGFQDADGCPDPDNDKDGIPDLKDKCPNEPEDKDGFQDEDGCPDPDNDKDGVPDTKDKCPNDAQGPDGKEGCPNLDKDGDGILDISDKCPNDPEDKDGFQDEDGCPDPDNDHDGFADAVDKCPNTPETVNGFEDEDGCPDKVKEIVKTLILKGVNFKTGSAELTPESYSVLDGLVPQLKAYPEMEFEVAGHTDNRGNPTKNQMLSQARAQTVANYFISKGVDAKQIKVMGYGSSRPIGPNTSAEGRALNRRVELNRIK